MTMLDRCAVACLALFLAFAVVLLYIAIPFGHIYLGTIGVAGTYGNIRNGYTDETWAKEHHEYWYNEVKTKAR
jgi:formate dehydrogenase subunit gamma